MQTPGAPTRIQEWEQAYVINAFKFSDTTNLLPCHYVTQGRFIVGSYAQIETHAWLLKKCLVQAPNYELIPAQQVLARDNGLLRPGDQHNYIHVMWTSEDQGLMFIRTPHQVWFETRSFLKWGFGEEEIMHEPRLFRCWLLVHQAQRPGASGSLLVIDSGSAIWIYDCQYLPIIHEAERPSSVWIFDCHWF